MKMGEVLERITACNTSVLTETSSPPDNEPWTAERKIIDGLEKFADELEASR